jgi:hypothetical protein
MPSILKGVQFASPSHLPAFPVDFGEDSSRRDSLSDMDASAAPTDQEHSKTNLEPPLQRGSLVWYQARDGSSIEALVTHVDNSHPDGEPGYTVELCASQQERSTVRDRLSPREGILQSVAQAPSAAASKEDGLQTTLGQSTEAREFPTRRAAAGSSKQGLRPASLLIMAIVLMVALLLGSLSLHASNANAAVNIPKPPSRRQRFPERVGKLLKRCSSTVQKAFGKMGENRG